MHAVESLRLPARLENLAALRQLALAAAARAGLAPEAAKRLDLVLEEALANIVHHAYADREGDVELACGVPAAGRVCLTLTDWGPPFDPLHVPDPAQEGRLQANREAGMDARAPGGLGLFLIRSMAKAGYRRVAEANELTLCIGP